MDAQEIGLSGLAAAEPERVFSKSVRRLAEHYRRPVPAVSVDAVRSWVALNPGLHGLPLLLTAAAVHAFLGPDAALGFSGASVSAPSRTGSGQGSAMPGGRPGSAIEVPDASSRWPQCRDRSMLRL